MRLAPSAVAILLGRDEAGELVTLVGTRHPRSRFLGGYVAFPGGAHEAQDGDLARDADAALRRTAARELREETGIEVEPDTFLDAGRRATPPFVPRGFDSRMLVGALDRIPVPRPSEPPELLDLDWTRPADLLRRWRALETRVAPPLLPIIAELARAGARGNATAEEIAARLRIVNEDMEEDGPRIEFVPDVLMIPVRTSTLPPATHTNCYLAGVEEIVVVDPGSADPSETARLLRHVRRRMAEGTKPKAILLTHHHGDHVAGAGALAAELAVPIFAHAETLARIGEDGTERVPLADTATIPLAGGERLVALLTPGHAPGHLAFFEETRGSLFAGDLVSGVSTILIDAAPGSLDLYLESLARLRDLPARTLFPGHGPPMIDPRGAIEALLEHRMQREERIVDAIRSGATALDEIARRAYADTPNADPALARRQAIAHLDRLEAQGRARRAGERWTLP